MKPIPKDVDMTQRNKLSKAITGMGLSSESLTQIAKRMEGKTQQEKEEIAKQILKEMGIE